MPETVPSPGGQKSSSPPLISRKRVCISKSVGHTGDMIRYLETLPVEILAEILLYCSSPKNLLAVARCSKRLCSTLVDEGNSFIWKGVRKTMLPTPMPDPLPQFTEPAYAAFVFDGGSCDICQKRVSGSYASFALRIRCCFQPECRKALSKNLILLWENTLLRKVKFWYLVSENKSCFDTKEFDVPWPSDGASYIRKSDWEKALIEYNEACQSQSVEAYVKKRDDESVWVKTHMKFYVQLFRWYQSYRAARKLSKAENDRITKRIAAARNWDFWDLKTTKTFGALHALRTGDNARISDNDFHRISDTVDREMIAKREKQKAKKNRDKQQENIRAIEAHYNRLRSSVENAKKIFPNLETFKRFSILVTLQATTSDANVDLDVQLKSSSLLAKVLDDEIQRWVEKARDEMCTVLGAPGWSLASTKEVHLVERVNARFRCISCDSQKKMDSPHKNHSLTFKAACSHNCPYRSKKEQADWSVSQFKADDKAIAAINKVLAIVHLDCVDPTTFDLLKAKGDVFACFSCEAAIVMSFVDIAEHAQRHEAMEIAVLTPAEAELIMTHKIEHGLTKKLFIRGHIALRLQSLTNFACRHCLQTRLVKLVGGEGATRNAQQGAEEGGVSMIKKKKQDKLPLFSFNGLRSHLKAKHGVLIIRDEDYFSNTPLDWTSTSQSVELQGQSVAETTVP